MFSTQWAMSMWWAPQSVAMPPEYSYHQRKRWWQRSGTVVDRGSLAEPEVPVQPLGHGLLLKRSAFAGRERQADGDLLDLAQASAAGRGHGAAEQLGLVAALLRADLHHLAGLLDGGDELLAFVDGQRQRLFAIDVLAGFERRQGDGRVPVVGRADRHGFDIVAIEQLAIVLEDLGLGEVLRSLARSACCRCTSHTATTSPYLLRAAGNAGALAAQADRAHQRAIVLDPRRRGPGWCIQ